jgi:hypothetical protein
MPKKKKPPIEEPPSVMGDNDQAVYRTIKMPIKKLFSNTHIGKIESAVQTIHKVTTLALDFVKLYVLHEFHNGREIPILGESFYDTVIRVVSRNKDERGRPLTTNKELYTKLLTFHEKVFLPLSPHNERVEVRCMSHILAYVGSSCATGQETNIKRNFTHYIRRYVNKYWLSRIYQEKGWADDYKMSKTERNQFYNEISHIKEDILFHRKWKDGGYRSLPQYHNWLDTIVNVIYPAPVNDYEAGMYYDVNVRPQMYLKYMLTIQDEFERMGVKMYSPICLRSSLSPKYIKLDYFGLLDLLVTDEDLIELQYHLNLPNIPTKGSLFDTVSTWVGEKLNERQKFYIRTGVWRHFMKFGTNKYTRHLLESKHYVFDNSILTDGVGVSVLQIRKDRVGKNCKSNKVLQIVPHDVPYLDDISSDECEYLFKITNVIGGDPGKKNIITLNSGSGKRLTYTSQQRSVECRFKKNKRAMVSMKTERVCSNGMSVAEVERTVTYNSKTCMIEPFCHYIRERRSLEQLVKPVLYEQKTPRKLILSAKLHTQKSQDKLLNNIIKTFSTPNKDGITIAWGNWNTPVHMKNFVPTPNIGLRRELCKKGRQYRLYIGRVPEAYTSCTCNTCHSKTGYFKERTYIKKGVQKTVDVHGLLRCQNERCSRLWNRDVLGSLNIRDVAVAVLQRKPRPVHFTIAHPTHAHLHG